MKQEPQTNHTIEGYAHLEREYSSLREANALLRDAAEQLAEVLQYFAPFLKKEAGEIAKSNPQFAGTCYELIETRAIGKYANQVRRLDTALAAYKKAASTGFKTL